MIEQEWLTSTDPAAMLAWLIGSPLDNGANLPPSVLDRKLRLFACACCRQVWNGMPCDFCKGKGRFETSNSLATCPRCLGPNGVGTGKVGGLTDHRSRNAMEVVERYADGLATGGEFNTACIEAGNARKESPYCPWNEQTPDQAKDMAAMTVCELFQPSASAAARHTARLAGQHATQAALLRCLFGNPWRPVTIERRVRVASGSRETPEVSSTAYLSWERWEDRTPPWLTPTVLGLARAIYDTRDWDALPVLADALDEAGCTEEALLRHLRGPAPHARGCWALDLILGKN